MAYTSTDLSTIQSAILALAAGTRIRSVSVGGKTIQYADGATLENLKALRSEIQFEIDSATAGKKRFVLTTTSKGL